MSSSTPFISSCSRRQLARRRRARALPRYQLALTVMATLTALAMVVVARGGV